MDDFSDFIRNRITQLRMKKSVSEYQMSLDLGMNKNYIQGITSGRSLPLMEQFNSICEYFEITPMQFFDADGLYPQLVRKAMDAMKELDDNDMLLLLTIIARLYNDVANMKTEKKPWNGNNHSKIS